MRSAGALAGGPLLAAAANIQHVSCLCNSAPSCVHVCVWTKNRNSFGIADKPVHTPLLAGSHP